MPKISPVQSKLSAVKIPVGKPLSKKQKGRQSKLKVLVQEPREPPAPLSDEQRLEIVQRLRKLSEEMHSLGTRLHGILSELTDVLVPQDECPF